MIKKIRFTLGTLLGVLLFLVPCHLLGVETGYKYFKNYNYKDYDHQAQNWGMVQGNNGIIYVANHGGVLEFDGVSWRIINIPNYTARSLAIDKTGTIYVGGINEFGYLAPDKTGALQYVSLRDKLDKLKEKHKTFADVWKTYAAEQGVCFHTSKCLFRWDNRQMKVWEPVGRFYYSFLCAGRFFIRQENTGLMEMIDDTLQPVPGGEIFIEKKIFMMAPYGTREILIGTDTAGFYLYSGTGIKPFPTRVDDEIKKSVLYHGTRLTSGDYALATLRGGVVIMDPRGERQYKADKSSGLLDDCVYYVYEDSGENLWLCLNKGIARIEYATPLSIHDERSGLAGIAMTVARHHYNLYVGTTSGLYYLERPYQFTFIPGVRGSCWSLHSTGETLLAAALGGVFQVERGKERQLQVINDPTFVLLPSAKDPGRIWCGTGTGLVSLNQRNGQWQEENRYASINQEIRTIAEDKNGSLWLGTATGSVLRMEFPGDIIHPQLTWYDSSQGLPGGHVFAAAAADHVMFATEKGIYRFDEEKRTFIPDMTIGGEFSGSPTARNVFRITEDNEKNIWIHSESRNYLAIRQAGGTFKIVDTPFRRIPLIQVNDIYPDPEGKAAWFASFDGLIRYESSVKKNYTQPFRTLLRKIVVNDTLFFAGAGQENRNTPPLLYPIFTYRQRNLGFEYAAPFFEVETGTRYRCYLEGYDDGWSTWSTDIKRNYTNLDNGRYTFRVQAENIYGHTGMEDVFSFRVLPPWTKTWWAFLLYGAGLVLLIFVIVRWRSYKLEEEKQKLEYTIKERTKEIQAKNLKLKEQSEQLKEMDYVKSRFFANLSHEFRTPLTLIMGPLEQMITENPDHRQKRKLGVMLSNTQRLLALINQLLDLSRFDSGKIKLQAVRQDIIPFLKSILSSFHLAAQKSQLELEFSSDSESIILYFDPPRMEEVMYNLLINAIRNTSAGGKITVSATLDQPRQQDRQEQSSSGNSVPGYAIISVRDTGSGIPLEHLPHIFERFYQARGPKQEVLKGTGIGLSLVKENVVLHHGKIDVHSQEGKGTEFVIRLPLGHDHLKQDEIIDPAMVPPAAVHPYKPIKDIEIEAFTGITGSEADGTGGEIEYDMEGNKQSEGLEVGEGTGRGAGETEVLGESPGQNQGEEKPVILVVEDHAEVRKFICDPLKSLYTVVEAGDGQEGVEKAREIIPDLIVSDIMMPKKDGCELCRELKTDIKTSHIPVILLTAKAAEESIIQGLETGADDYITKPFNAKILLTRIKNLIELRRQLQQKIQKQMLLQPAEIAVSSMDQEFIKELQESIEENLAESGFNVEQLSKKLYMNRATLYRKMMALTGETPTEFIRSYRLQRAAQLLKDKFGTVSQVASAVGFENPAYFAKCFREKFHQLPSSYQAAESE